MSKPEPKLVDLLADPDFLRAAVTFTAKETEFPPRLIEKDYLCTVLLDYLATAAESLVFKGGTCLAKVHGDFYRLSEDLDFVIPMPTDSPRSQRSQRAKRLKPALDTISELIPSFRWVEPLKGANNSTQYMGVLGYQSLVGPYEDTIKIEIAMREPLYLPTAALRAEALLLDPNSRRRFVAPVALHCISRTEAFAEKFRAALSRRAAAIRDFFDLDYAVRRLGIQPENAELIGLVRQKLAVPGNSAVDVSPNRIEILRQHPKSGAAWKR